MDLTLFENFTKHLYSSDAKHLSPIDEEELSAVESTLEIRFPEDYRAFVTHYPCDRLDNIDFGVYEEGEEPLAMEWLIQPKHLINHNQDYWRSGWNAHFVAIGEDSVGNLFYYEKMGVGPVWVWNEKSLKSEIFSHSFSQLLEHHLSLPLLEERS